MKILLIMIVTGLGVSYANAGGLSFATSTVSFTTTIHPYNFQLFHQFSVDYLLKTKFAAWKSNQWPA